MTTSSRSAPWVLWGLGSLSLLPFAGGVRLALGLGLRLLPTVFMGLFLGRLLLGRGLLLRRALGLLLRRLDHLGLGLVTGTPSASTASPLGRNDHLLLDPHRRSATRARLPIFSRR